MPPDDSDNNPILLSASRSVNLIFKKISIFIILSLAEIIDRDLLLTHDGISMKLQY